MAVIEYDHSPNISSEQRLRSLADSVRRAFEELENNGGSKGNDVLKLGAVASENIVPIKKGGTDANTAARARQNINFIGVNPIASVEEDTTANWAALGSGIAYFNTDGIINDQKSQYGFVVNYTSGSLVRQIWHAQSASGNVYVRSGNASGWYSSDWQKLLTEKTGIQIEKLWQNASPTSSFAAQELDIDGFTEYDMYVVQFYMLNTNLTSMLELFRKGYTSYVTYESNISSTSALLIDRRTVLFSENQNKITISDNTRKKLSDNSYSTDNTRLIPVVVYGIKGVQ